MIFAVIGEELGLVGVDGRDRRLRGLRLRRACRSRSRARIRSASASRRASTALVCGQAAINLAAVLGLAPLTGIPLPFVSYGGSSLVVALASVGILLNIAGSDAAAEQDVRVPDRSRRDGRTRAAGAGGRGRAARGAARA